MTTHAQHKPKSRKEGVIKSYLAKKPYKKLKAAPAKPKTKPPKKKK